MISVLGVLLFVTGLSLAKECVYDDFRTCFNEGLEPVDFSIESEEHLKEVCKVKREAMQCAKDFIDNCMEHGKSALYEASVSGNMKVVESVCEEGSEMNRDFLGNLGCFKKVREDVTFCYDKLKESQVALSKADDLMPRLKVFYQCCAFEWHRNCLGKTGRAKCSEEAGDFMYHVATVLGGNVNHQICSSFYSDCRGLHGVNQTEINERLDSLSDGVGRMVIHSLTVTLLSLAVLCARNLFERH